MNTTPSHFTTNSRMNWAFLAALLLAIASITQAQSVFNLNSFHGYINVPTVTANGTLLVHNTNPRPVGSAAYVTGVANAPMPVYSAGDTLQWAMLARSTKSTAAVLKFGVQTGNGDENNLSIGDTSMTANPGAFQWIVSTSRVVNASKPQLYFYIPGAIGQEIEIKDLILGNPASVASYIAAHPGANLLTNSGFEVPASTVPVGTLLTGNGYGGTAAQNWSYADNGDITVAHSTVIEHSTLVGGSDGMLHVKASGFNDGAYQYFLPQSGAGLSNVTVSAWVYVLSGQVTVYSGRAGGVSGGHVATTTTGQWQHLQFNTGANFITGIFVYSTSPSGAEYYVDNVSVTPDGAPVANAGTNQSVNELDAVTLDGSQSSDPDLDPITYSWLQILGSPTVTLNGANTAHPSFTAPDLPAHADGTTLTFRLTVSDGILSSTSDVNVRVSSINHVPLADAGQDQSVAERSVVNLDGSNSADTDGDALSYSWTQIAGPAVMLSDAHAASPSFTAPTVGTSGGTLTFQLLVDDGYGGTATDTVSILLSYSNRNPVAEAGSPQTVNEGDVATLSGSGMDPDNNTLTYSWTQVAGPTVSLSDATIAGPTFVAPNVTRAEADVLLALTVDDGYGGTSTDYVTIHIANVNHAPTADAPANFSTPEGSNVELLGLGSDPDTEEQSVLQYSWQQIAGPAVSLGGSGADATFTAPLVTGGGDPNAKQTLTFRLTVTDPNGSSATDDVDVTVANVDHSPTADAGGSRNVDEATLVSLNGTNSMDPDGDALSYEWTQLGGPAVVLNNSHSATPSFTAPFVNASGATLKFKLTVNDGFGGSSSDIATVHVANVNDPPSIANAQPSVSVLWSPDHRMVPISIIGVVDPNNNATVRITGVTQDEPTNGQGDGDTAIDAIINPDGTALLRAERSGKGDGRVYRVSFTAFDFEGSSSGVVKVMVPKSKKTDGAIDSGAVFDSTH